MWLSRLDLLAFGKFTNVQLDLGPGFHLIYGPNEAGKSTTLRAIRQLLFGFDERPVDNFLHANPNLRIGGIIRTSSGDELAVVRRKARKESLRGRDDDSIINPDLWSRILSGLDESLFRQRYGIDYQQLVEGGRQIATGSGDLGEILFATGSGVMDLNAIKRGLTQEAEEIFKPQGKKQRLNLAIVRWQELKDRVNEKRLSVSDWEETDQLRQETTLRLESVTAELSCHSKAFEQSRRWQQAWPLVQELDSLEHEIARLATVPRLNQDFASKRQEAFLLLKQSNQYQVAAREAIERAQKELEKLQLPVELVSQADEIARVVMEWNAVQQGMRDRQNLVQQKEQHSQAIQRLNESSIVSVHSFDRSRLTLDLARRTRLGQLGRQQAGLIQSLENAEAYREGLNRQLEEIRTLLATASDPVMLDEFRNLLKTVQNDGDLETRLRDLQKESCELREAISQQIEQLGFGSKSLSEILNIQHPDSVVCGRFQSDFRTIQTEHSMLQSRLAELITEHEVVTQNIKQLRQEFLVPTEADLETARSERDAIWSQIRQQWNIQSQPDSELIERFEQSVVKADLLSDRLRHEADRVAQLAEELANLNTNESRQHEISVRLAELDSHRLSLQKQWQSLWQNLDGLAPLPSEVPAWLARRDLLLQNGERVRRCESDAALISERIQGHIATLRGLLGIESDQRDGTQDLVETSRSKKRGRVSSKQLSFGWEPPSELSPDGNGTNLNPGTKRMDTVLKDLLSRAEERLQSDEAAQQSHRVAVEKTALLTRELAESSKRVVTARNELLKWNADWKETMSAIGLSPEFSPEDADAIVQILSEIANHQALCQQLQDRITGIDEIENRYVSAARSLCQKVSPDHADLPVEQIVERLRVTLVSCQTEQSIRKEQTARKTQAEEQFVLSQESQAAGERLYAELCQELKNGLTEASTTEPAALSRITFEELEQAEKQSAERDQYESKRNRIRIRLGELAGEESFEIFVGQVRLQTLEVLATKIHEHQTEIKRLATEKDQLLHQLGGIDSRLKLMNGGGEAAEAEEVRQQCLAQMRSDAEEYIRLKLASSVLRTCIERYREKIRGPVLKTAGQLFQELTLGSFEGLRVDEDESHKPVLVGVRSGGLESVVVNAMSEGTCDQLYLALRLASLQLETSPRSELPLIIDDILVQFDDARAIAALRVLNQQAEKRQVIFFTHHEHLIDLASKYLTTPFKTHRLIG